MNFKATLMSLPLAVLPLICTAPAHAQFNAALSVNVPFRYAAGSQSLPPGEYQVKSDPVNHRVLLQGNGKASILIGFNAVSFNPANPCRLVFARYGSVYFLSEVWTGESDYGIQLPKSKAEKEHLARGETKDETVALLASR